MVSLSQKKVSPRGAKNAPCPRPYNIHCNSVDKEAKQMYICEVSVALHVQSDMIFKRDRIFTLYDLIFINYRALQENSILCIVEIRAWITNRYCCCERSNRYGSYDTTLFTIF